MGRIFTNGQRRCRRISLAFLFVLIRKIRGSNIRYLDIRAGRAHSLYQRIRMSGFEESSGFAGGNRKHANTRQQCDAFAHGCSNSVHEVRRSQSLHHLILLLTNKAHLATGKNNIKLQPNVLARVRRSNLWLSRRAKERERSLVAQNIHSVISQFLEKCLLNGRTSALNFAG
jgi:hypothetical protein